MLSKFKLGCVLSIILVFASALALSAIFSKASTLKNATKDEESLTLSDGNLKSSCIDAIDAYKAEWKETNSQKYLQIIAKDQYNLGKAYGENLYDKILYMHYFLQNMLDQYNIPDYLVTYYVSLYYPYIPQEYKEFLQGIDEIVPISLTDVVLQNIWLDVFYGQLTPISSNHSMPPIQELLGCTSLGAENRGGVVVGMNLDLHYLVKNAISYVKYWIPGKLPVFALHVGSMALSIGKNSFIKSTLNLVQTIIQGNIGIATGIKSRIAFENAWNLNQFLDLLYSENNFVASWNNIVADKRNVLGVETIPNSITITNCNNWIVRSNTYINPFYRPYLISQEYSVKRQYQAERFMKVYYASGRKLSTHEMSLILNYRDEVDKDKCIFRLSGDSNNPLSIGLETISTIIMEEEHGFFRVSNEKDSQYGIIPSFYSWNFKS